MNPKDQLRVLSLPKKDQEAAWEDEKKKVFAAGGDARRAYSYLDSYIERKKFEHFEAFASLPRDAELRQYQAVQSSFLAILEMEKDIKGKIIAADRLADEPIDEEKTETNI
jgi:hypothetical protein